MEEMRMLKTLTERYPVLDAVKTQIEEAYRMMEVCYENGGKLLVGGNGGSSADAEHIVGELMKGFLKKRSLPEALQEQLKAIDPERGACLAEKLQGALPAIAISGHYALSSAFANDVDPVLTYAQQVMGYGNPGDVFFAISTSGNAENVIYAAVAAKARGMKIVALTGKDGGKLAKLADVSIIVPLQETYQIQELHLPIYHAFCLMLEERFF